MAKHLMSKSTPLTAAICLALLLTLTKCIHAARVLDEQQAVDATAPASSLVIPDPPVYPQLVPSQPDTGATTPSTAASKPSDPASSPIIATPPAISPVVQQPASSPIIATPPAISPVVQQPASSPIIATPPAISPVGQQPPDTQANDQTLTFFMHDILGGSKPSALALILNNANSATNTLPIDTNSANLPSATSQQNVPFGAIIVIDDELTEGRESGSNVIGRGQGIYVATSQDGTSHTLMLTAMYNGEGNATCTDTLSIFGVHCPSAPDSRIAIIGGTGKFENARGYAVIKSIPDDPHTTDGVETLLQFSIYLS